MTALTMCNPCYVPDETRPPDMVMRPLPKLAGARVALVKNAWPSWHAMVRRLGSLLAERVPEVSTAEHLVPNGSAADGALLGAIAASSDCAVVGLANCGSCTAWSFHDAAELARLGVPVVLVVTSEFTGLASALAKATSSPLPMVEIPVNPETVDDQMGEALLDAAFDDILAALTAEEAGSSPAAAPASRPTSQVHVQCRDEEDAHDRYGSWSDGLPIVLPTPDAVEAMLTGGAYGARADDIVAHVPPSGFGLTYRTLATNAVMAGCAPEHMPVLVAVLEAACAAEFNLHGIATTTGPSTPMVILNGPVASSLGVNASRGALGPGFRANATIGRALRLVINNVGGAVPGEVSKSIMGQPGRFSFCFAENEAESPWEPLHVTLGCSASQSAATVVGATGSMNLLTPRRDVDAMLTLLADGFAYLGNPNVAMGRGTVAALITPGHARAMAAAGMSKRDVAASIWQRSAIPIERFPRSAYPDAPYEFINHDGMIYPVADPEHVLVVVVGGPEPTHATLVPSHPSSQPATRIIEAASLRGRR